jgi:hypothetical protein
MILSFIFLQYIIDAYKKIYIINTNSVAFLENYFAFLFIFSALIDKSSNLSPFYNIDLTFYSITILVSSTYYYA